MTEFPYRVSTISSHLWRAIVYPPGPRPHYHEHYYGAFVLDPDGHNIEACCHTG